MTKNKQYKLKYFAFNRMKNNIQRSFMIQSMKSIKSLETLNSKLNN